MFVQRGSKKAERGLHHLDLFVLEIHVFLHNSIVKRVTERVRQFLLFLPFGNPCELNCLNTMANSMRCDTFGAFSVPLNSKLTKKTVMPY